MPQAGEGPSDAGMAFSNVLEGNPHFLYAPWWIVNDS